MCASCSELPYHIQLGELCFYIGPQRFKPSDGLHTELCAFFWWTFWFFFNVKRFDFVECSEGYTFPPTPMYATDNWFIRCKSIVSFNLFKLFWTTFIVLIQFLYILGESELIAYCEDVPPCVVNYKCNIFLLAQYIQCTMVLILDANSEKYVFFKAGLFLR